MRSRDHSVVHNCILAYDFVKTLNRTSKEPSNLEIYQKFIIKLLRHLTPHASTLSQLEAVVESVEVLESGDVPLIELGIDFYAEIRRYEILLIRRALRHAGGSQTRPAALLKLNPQTINAKIKHFAIEANEHKLGKSVLSVIP